MYEKDTGSGYSKGKGHAMRLQKRGMGICSEHESSQSCVAGQESLYRNGLRGTSLKEDSAIREEWVLGGKQMLPSGRSVC